MADFMVVIELSEWESTMEKTEEKMRLTVDRLWSSEEQADPWSLRWRLRCRSFMSVIFIKLIMKTVKDIS